MRIKVVVNGLLGRKRGMVQVIQDDGTVAGCTVLEVGPCAVTQIRTLDRDGYQAVQLGFENSPEWKMSRAERGHTAASGTLRHLAEFDADSYDDLNLGQTITITDIFTVGDRVDVQGIGKGKGLLARLNGTTFLVAHELTVKAIAIVLLVLSVPARRQVVF